MNLIYLVLLAAIGGVFSLAGALLLVNSEKAARLVSKAAAPFAAGSLLAAVFLDLLPEALELGDVHQTLLWAFVGIAVFFLLERRLSWFHHHHEHNDSGESRKRVPFMLVIGDTIHNAIDGAAIAIAFLAEPSLGVITAIAVALHEIPQEIGDFGLLLKFGWKKKKVIMVNLLSAMATILVAAIVYFIGESAEKLIAPSLGLVSGTLLYIALSDVVPTVHEARSGNKWVDNSSLLFILGIVTVWLAITASGLIGAGH